MREYDFAMASKLTAAAAGATLALLQVMICVAQEAPPPAQPHDVPVIQANLGDCSVEIKVTDTALKPVYKADISTQLRYGFGGFHHLDLEVETNIDGRARFEGLTNKARMPLAFDVLYESRYAVVVVDLTQKCHAVERSVLPDKRPEPTASE
jgi:hypothetical protein